MKWSEGLRNKVSAIIRRYVARMMFAVFMAVSFITFFHILLVPFFITAYMVVCFVRFCLILRIMYSYCYVIYCYCYVYVFLLLCMFCSVYTVSLCCSV